THKIGLIDMAHVFKNYKKFEVLREGLKAEIEQSDAKAKQMAADAQALQKEMQSYKEGSPDYIAAEKKLAGLAADFEAYRQVQQKEFLRKESQIYRTIYLEVTDAVDKYAQYYKYTLILRFDRSGLEEAQTPQDLLQRMNREVIYHRGENDITLSVLDYLNRKYTQTAERAPATGTRQQ
ncbi:MAG: OmpH family outer membrane protein, partial [Planctomycetaceae bacterium]